MLLMRQGIIIDCGRKIKGQTPGFVPPVATNDDRYADYTDKLASRGLAPKVNNHPWAWRSKKPPKTFLSKATKKQKAQKRIKETIPV